MSCLRAARLLQVTFADQLGSAAHSDSGEVASKQEAKRLAFYLFWNIKPYFDRCTAPSDPTLALPVPVDQPPNPSYVLWRPACRAQPSVDGPY